MYEYDLDHSALVFKAPRGEHRRVVDELAEVETRVI